MSAVTTDTAKRRAIIRDILIATAAIAVGAWVSTWSWVAGTILAVVIVVVMAFNYKKFHS